MGAVAQNLALAASLAGAVAVSQLPEFAQQYRQRIGGAVAELSRSVSDFDRDAASAGLTRLQELDRHRGSPEPLFRARGLSAQRSVERLERLSAQEAEFTSLSQTWQPLVLARADRELVDGTWRDFRPAVPVTLAGLIWSLAGFVIICPASAPLAQNWV